MKKNILLLLYILFATILSAQTEKDSLILEIDKSFNSQVYFKDVLQQTLTEYAYNLPHINETYWENVSQYFYTSYSQNIQDEMAKVCNKDLSLEELKIVNEALLSGEKLSEEIWDILEPVNLKLHAYFRQVITIKLYKDLMYKGLIPKLEDQSICKELQDGHFLNLSTTKQDTVYISRKGNKQVEKYRGYTAVFDIEWHNDASYTLTIFESDDPQMIRWKENDQGLTAEIVEVTDEFYRCVYYDFIEGRKYYDMATIYFNKDKKPRLINHGRR
jgi:hypothetical protein